MPIVFAENFSQDTPASLIKRYPGTFTKYETKQGAFPVAFNTQLETGFNPNFGNRVEILLGLSGEHSSNVVNGVLNVFGIQIVCVSATLAQYGLPSLEYTGVPTSINFVLDRVKGDLFNITPVINDTVLGTMPYYWNANTYFGLNNLPTATVNSKPLPRWLDYIVVAKDTPTNTRINSASFLQKSVMLDSPGSWYSVDGDLVSVVDRSDPEDSQTTVGTEDDSVLTYSSSETTHLVTAYVAAGTDVGYNLEVNGKVQQLGPIPRPLPPLRSRTISLKRGPELPSGAKSNTDGLTFLGERTGILTYADASTAAGVTLGALNAATGDPWLHVILDGKELLVSKIPIRRGVSWESLYNAGVVFGSDVVLPTMASYPQNKTVDIAGKVYKFRLLTGSGVQQNQYWLRVDIPDGVGNINQASEWDRIFGALSAGYNYYEGDIALASYSTTDLGVGSSTGSICWTQTFHDINSVNSVYPSIVCRGGTSDMYSYQSNRADSSGVSLGWRPVLELIQE